MKYYVIETTKNGILYKKNKCVDGWSKVKESCWKFSKQGAEQIADRLNKQNEWRKDKVHYNILKAE